MTPFSQVILNPTAGSGNGSRLQGYLRDHLPGVLGGEVRFALSGCAGDAIRLAREAVTAGAGLIVAVGGDGTVHEVVNGMLEGDAVAGSCRLGIIHCGTGGGLAQTLGLKKPVREQLGILAANRTGVLDAGIVWYAGQDGEDRRRYFVSEVQAGIGGAVVAGVGSEHKKLGGTLAFASVSVRSLLGCRPAEMTVGMGNGHSRTGMMLGVTVGNGRYCAGGMQLTPCARFDDGMLDILTIGEMSLVRRLWSFSKVYAGKHAGLRHFSLDRAATASIVSDGPVRISADGELLGETPCRVGIIPGALQVIIR